MNFREQIELNAKDNASSVIRGVMGNLRGLIGQMAALAGVGGVGAAFGAAVKEGLGFQKMLEDSRISIAGVVGALHEYRTANGDLLTGEAKWQAALSDSAAVQEKLRTAALTTTATYGEMVDAFTTGVGPMSRAGIALDDTAEATQRLTQVAAAASLPMAQLAIEMRQFFNGDEVRSRLLQTLQITKEQIEEHKKLGDMMEFLREKTESYARAAQAATTSLTGMWSNVKDAIQQTLGVGMAPLFDKLKGTLGAISDQFVSFGKDSKGNLTAQFNPELIARIETFAETLGDALGRFKEMIPAVVDFGLALAQHVSTGIELLSKLPLKAIIEGLTKIIELTEGWGLALAGVLYTIGGFKGVAAMVGGIGSAFVKVGAIVDTVGTGIASFAGYITAMSAAAGVASAVVVGLFAALAVEVGALMYALKKGFDLLKEYKATTESDAAAGGAMLRQLQNLRERMAKSSLPDDEFESINARAWKLTNAITEEMGELKRVTSITRDEYAKFLKDMKTQLPDDTGASKVKREVANLSAEIVEARKKWEEFAGKVNDKYLLSSLDGMEKKLQETKDAIRDAATEARTLASAAGLDPSGALKKISETEWRDFAKAFKAQPAEIVGTWDAEFKKLPGTVRTYLTATQKESKTTIETWRGKLEKEAAWLLNIFVGEDSVGAGIKAGWLSVTAALPTAAESAAGAVQDVWAGMARAFDDTFFSVLTGKLDSLKDVFKNLWESILQTASRYFSDLLQRWLATQMQMGQPAKGTYPGVSGSGGGESGGRGTSTLAYVAAAGAGYGFGGMIGQGTQANAIGGAAGAALGAYIGSSMPIVGTIIGAIVGGLIGELFNKNTERSMTGSLGAMAGATSWEKRPIYERGGRDPFRIGDEYDPGEPIGYEWVGTLQQPSTAFEREGQRVFQGQTATLADIFRVGAEDQARDLLESYRQALKDSLSGANFKIAAGSEEDIEKDAQYLLQTLLPRIGLSAAFGQKGYLPPGYRDLPGGVPGTNYGMPGMDEAGNWIEKQLYDPEAPIPKMLAGLGFTEAKISELAGRISTDDPEKLLAYIQGIVGIVVEVDRLTGEMGKSFEELAATWDAEAAAGPAAAFGEQAQEIADAFGALDLYSGDEQIAKAQEAIGLSDQFWQSVESYLRQLQASVEKMSASLQSQRQTMRDFLNPVGADEGAENAWGEVSGVWGKLRNAVDPGDVEKAVSEARAAIDKVFAVMAERINRGRALLEKLGGLGSISDELTREGIEAADPLRAWGREMADMQRKVEEASRQSGLAQIQTLEEVGASAEEMYRNLKGFLADIASTSASINKSIDSQIWELGVGEMDPQGQAGAITARIKELQDQLALATSPAEIAAITSEIQSLTGRYVGTFGKDDPKRQEAIDWATEQLERARGLANETLDVLKAQAEAYAKQLEGTITTVTGLLEKNIGDATTTIGQLSHTLGELDRVMREAMENLGDGILESLEPLRTAMNGAADIFRNATDTASNALTEPEVGLAAAADRSATRLDAFTSALDRAITKANAFADSGSEGTGDGSGRPPARSGNTPTTATIIATNRRYARYMTPRVA